MTLEKAFSNVLRTLRKQKNISQEKLAFESDLDRTFISLLERGLRQPSLSTVFQIASALSLEPSELISLVQATLSEQRKEGGKFENY